ncbi:MAG: DUF4249 domain-containing protein [Marinilabiliales bacterium]|nr:DUF4249 domain-containing protein [Marinilabiliales bacterium]
MLLIPFLTACEKIYTPDIETVSGQLVVDARITNDPNRNYIHLSRTRSFYDVMPVLEVSGATVTLVEMGGPTIKSYESSTGHYTLNGLPTPGKQYFLRIVMPNSINTYESRAVTMPAAPVMTNLTNEHIVQIVNENSGESTPRTYERPARQINVDVPISNNLSYFRLDVRSLLEYTYTADPGHPHLWPTAYGWFSYQNKQHFNLVGPSEAVDPTIIRKHQLQILSYDPFNSAQYDTLVVKGWILLVDMFSTSKESYDYHQQLNGQFDATGSLFDPIQTQVYGNIICKTNPNEKVYGYFDLNSFSEYRYYIRLNLPPAEIVTREIFKYPVIPYSGLIYGIEGEPPIKPSWWEE